MKRAVTVVLVVLMAVFSLKAFAAAAGEAKFGYVDFQRALNEAEEGKKAKAMLKSEFEEKQKKLDSVQNELQAMKNDLDKQRLILSADALKEKEEAYRKKFIELQQKLGSFKEELASKEAKLTSDILVVMHSIVKGIGDKEGFTMILEKSQDVVLYSKPEGDITDRVIKEYNGMDKGKKQSIISAAGGSKPAAPAKADKKATETTEEQKAQ